MITHYTTAAEVDRHRRDQIAAGIVAARRRIPRSPPRWRQFGAAHLPTISIQADTTVLSVTA